MIILTVALLACALWAVIAALLIAHDLNKRGVAVRFFWLRFMILRHLGQYARITQEQDGRVGPLFYHYVVPLNLALVLGIVLAVMAAR